MRIGDVGVRDTRLILIDGLPGSGKTTTATILTARLREAGIAVACLLEIAEDGRDHPLNVGGALHPAGRTTGAQLFSRYSVEAYVAESLRRWRAFVDAAARADALQIVESYPYQNSVRVLLQMDAEADTIRSYAAAVEQVILPLHPVLIFFKQQDVVAATRAIAGQRGPEWTAYIADLVAGSPYARRLGLRGFEGVLAVMATYKEVLDGLRRESQLPTLALEGCDGRWDACHQQIAAFLQL